MSQAIPILTYHRIDNDGLSTSTAPDTFAQHMNWLADHGWRSLTTNEFAFYANRHHKFPAKSFLLSFDDGYESVASNAFPVLKDLNFHSICFVATRHMRQSNNHVGSSSADDANFLTWQQLRDLHASGLMEVHSHTHAHAQSTDYTEAQLKADLTTSLDLLSTELALPRTCFRHLAWPWGYSNDTSREIARKAGFRYQYTVSRSAYLSSSPLEDIPRTCYDGATLVNFKAQLHLQCGPLSSLWHAAYPLMRRVRHTPVRSLFRQRGASSNAASEIEPV